MLEIKNIKLDCRATIFSAIFAVLFSMTTFWGIALDNLGTIQVKYNRLSIFIFFIISYTIFRLFLKYLPKIELFLTSIKPLSTIDKLFFQNNFKSFWKTFLFIALCHFPIFLAYFPGIYTYDVLFQTSFFVNHDYIEIHPLIHNLMVYGIWLFSKNFHIPWGGVFLYTLFQTTIVYLIFSYNIKFLSKYNFPFIFKFFALLFFAFYPTNQVFPLVITKDVLFSSFVLLFILILSDCIFDSKSFFSSKFKYLFLSSSIFLIFLFRHNGFPAYLLLTPVLIIYLINTIKTNTKKILIMLLLPIFLFQGFSYIKHSIGIIPIGISTSLEIPLQQLGRVRILKNNELSIDDIKIYRQLIPPKNELKYCPIDSDFIRYDEISAEKNFGMLHTDYIDKSLGENFDKFLYLYSNWAKKYPGIYLDAFLHNSYGYWYFFKKYTTFLHHRYLYTFNGYSNMYGVKISSSFCFNQPIRILYDNIFLQASFVKNPILFLMFSIGVNTWFIIIGFLILLYKRKYNCIVSLSIIITLLLSILVGPIVLLRYIYQNFLILPLLFAFCFGDINEQNNKST